MEKLTPRQRIWHSIRHQQPDQVPWHLGCTVPTRQKLEAHFGSLDLDNILNQHIVKQRIRLPYTEITPGFFQDEFGTLWNRTIDKDIGNVTDYLLKERTLKGFNFPDPHDPRRLAPLPAFYASHPDRFHVLSVSFSMFERAWILRGMENLMVDMIEAPAFVDELLDAILAYDLAILEDAFHYDIDGVIFGDDWGQQNGLIFGPRLWRRLIKPRMAKLFAATHAAGKAVFLHCCGKVQELFPELIEIGLDVFNPFQPEVMDPFAIKKQFGDRLCFYGGVSIQKLLPFGTPAQVRSEVKRLKQEIGQGGGYILAPSHDMPGDIPLENLLALIEAARSVD